jgi:hypothetical protein
MVYAALFATGNWIYGRTGAAVLLTVVAAVAGAVPLVLWRRLNIESGVEQLMPDPPATQSRSRES